MAAGEPSNATAAPHPETAQYLWSVLSDGTVWTDADRLRAVLERCDRLLEMATAGFVDKPTAADPQQPRDASLFSVNPVLLDFVDEAATLLRIDFASAYDYFCSFLFYEFSCDRRDIDQVVKERLQRRDLLRTFASAVLAEQAYAFRCFTEVAKRLSMELEESLAARCGRPALAGKLLATYCRVRRFKLPKELVCANVIGRLLALQSDLLVLLLWLFHVFEMDAEVVRTALRVYKDGIFDVEASNSSLLGGHQSAQWLARLRSLEDLFFMKLCNVEALSTLFDDTNMEDVEAAKQGMIEWFKDAQVRFEEVVTSICPCQRHAGVHMFWALNRELCALMEDSSNREASIKYSAIAKEHQWLTSCSDMLSRLQGAVDDDTYMLACCAVYSALDQCLTLYEIESLGDRYALLKLVELLLCCKNVSDQVMAAGFRSGLSEFLRDTVYLFPCHFRPAIDLLSSVASTSDNNAMDVFKLFLELPCCTEPLFDMDQSNQIAIFSTEDENVVYKLNQSRHLFGYPSGMCIPAGTVGTICDRFNCIQWRFFYNGWQLCLRELTRLRDRSDSESVGRKAAVFRLVRLVLKRSLNIGDQLNCFFPVTLFTLASRAEVEADFMLMWSEGVELLAAFVKEYGHAVISQLIFSGLFNPCSDMTLQSFGYMMLRCGDDCSRLLCAFLELCVSMLDAPLDCKQEPAALPCSWATMSKILAASETWQHPLNRQWARVSFLCMRVVQLCLHLEPESAVSEEDRLSRAELRAACEQSLLSMNGRYVLLRIISTGEPKLSILLSECRTREARSWVVDALTCALSNLNSLVIRYTGSAEPLLRDLFTGFEPFYTEPLISIIAKYTYNCVSVRVPLMAINLLTTVAQRYPGALLSTMGSFVAAFCDIFTVRLQTMVRHPALTAQCLRFLSVAIEHQFGLVEQLLIEADGEESKPSPLFTTLANMGRGCAVRSEVYTTTMDVWYKMWKCRCHLFVDRLKKTADFWATLCAPLTGSEETFLPALAAPVWKIVACELCAQGTLDAGLKVVLKRLCQADRLALDSKKVICMATSLMDLSARLDVLKAFRDFLQATREHCSEFWTEEATVVVLNAFSALFVEMVMSYSSEEDMAPLALVGSVIFLMVAQEPSVSSNTLHAFSLFCRILEVVAYSNLDCRTLKLLLFIVLPSLLVLLKRFKQRKVPSEKDLVSQVFTILLEHVCRVYRTFLVTSPANGDTDLLTNWKTSDVQGSVTMMLLCLLDSVLAVVDRQAVLDVLEKHEVWSVSVALLQANKCAKVFQVLCGFFTNCVVEKCSAECKYWLEKFAETLSLHKYKTDDDDGVACLEAAVRFFTKTLRVMRGRLLGLSAQYVCAQREHFVQLCRCCVGESRERAVMSVLQFFAVLIQPDAVTVTENFDTHTVVCDCTQQLMITLLWRLSRAAVSKQKTDGLNAIYILLLAVGVLSTFTPRLDEFNFGACMVDVEAYRLILRADFGQHFVVHESMPDVLSFGQMINCAQHCAASLRQHDSPRTSVGSGGPHMAVFAVSTDEERRLVRTALEMVLCFILSQMSLYASHPRVDQAIGSMVRSEAAAEVCQIAQWCLKPSMGAVSVRRRKGDESGVSSATSLLKYICEFADSALRCGQALP